MNKRAKTAALVCAGLALALAAGGCEDADAVAKAEAAAKAKTVAAEKAAKLKRQADHNVDCLSALRWQEAALSSAGIGDLKIYQDYYRTRLDETVGSAMIENDGGPRLARSTMHDYLEWAYAENVRAKFNAGTDTDKDGTVSDGERSEPGLNRVAACVLEVAEAGQGPLAGSDKVARVQQISAVRARLKPKGA